MVCPPTPGLNSTTMARNLRYDSNGRRILTVDDFQSISTVSVAPSRKPFERRVEEVKPSKADINALIMDYFVSEGYVDAARQLAKEANLRANLDETFIHERKAIKDYILAGDIQSAIERLNDLNPQILDADPKLHFSLLRLQLIELIRIYHANACTDPLPAIQFAQENLAPRAPTNPVFLAGLESAMLLLWYEPDEISQLRPDLSDELCPQLRQDIAGKVMEAILTSNGQRPEAKVKDLVRLRVWAERRAREAKKNIPAVISLGLQNEEDAAANVRDEVEGPGTDDDEDETGEDDYTYTAQGQADLMMTESP